MLTRCHNWKLAIQITVNQHDADYRHCFIAKTEANVVGKTYTVQERLEKVKLENALDCKTEYIATNTHMHGTCCRHVYMAVILTLEIKKIFIQVT